MRIKKVILLLTASIIFTKLSGQDFFEGTISSRINIELKKGDYSKDFLAENFGTQTVFTIKDGMTKTVTNSDPKRVVYVKDGKSYTKVFNNDTIVINNLSTSQEILEDWSLTSNQAEILGLKCDLLKLKVFDPQSGYRYNLSLYFSPEIKANPNWFEGIKFQNSEFIYSKTKSVPIKTVIDDDLMTITIEPKSIKKLDLKGFESDFESFIKGKPLKNR